MAPALVRVFHLIDHSLISEAAYHAKAENLDTAKAIGFSADEFALPRRQGDLMRR